MTRLNRRRLAALLAPIPVLAAAAWIIKSVAISGTLKMTLQAPAVCFWYLLAYLGIRSPVPAFLSCLAYWYLLLSLGFYAILCPRDRISRSLLICVVATSTLVFLMAWMLRGFNSD